MAETTSDRAIITSSSWWIWILLAIGVAVIIMIIYGGWRLFRGATQVVKQDVPSVTEARPKPEFRFVRTPKEVVVIDDPILPAGETSLEDIANNFAEYQGEKVTVSGNISKLETTSFFTLSQGESAIGILSLPEAIKKNELEDVTSPSTQYVKVNGIVKLLTREREKKKFGLDYRDLDEAFWHDQMIIEAESIEIISPETI
jgi:hypothetical protein